MGCTPRRKARPRIVALDRDSADIVHRGAAEAAVGDPKPSGFDDRRIDAETCAGAHHGAGILCDVGLEQSKQERRGGRGDIPRESKRLTAERAIRRILRSGGSNAEIAAMDIQFDRCEKPHRTNSKSRPRGRRGGTGWGVELIINGRSRRFPSHRAPGAASFETSAATLQTLSG